MGWVLILKSCKNKMFFPESWKLKNGIANHNKFKPENLKFKCQNPEFPRNEKFNLHAPHILITSSKIYCKNKTRQNKYSDSMQLYFVTDAGGFFLFFYLFLKILHTKLLFPSYHLFFISNM